ncbi:MAG: hypothetical protein J6W94_03655 [Bacteroidales bacterium]|nr:hypothetical protein [Bacteroidales bacterium]
MKKIAFVMMAAAALFFTFSCNPDETPSKDKDKGKEEQKEEEQPKINITIDGQFDDWAAMDASLYVSAKNNPNSPWEGVAEIRCCADPDFVYYYIKFNKEAIEEQLANNESLPIRLCINTDGEFESGYTSYFLEGYDFIIEGPLGNGEGGWGEYDGTLHQRIGSWVSLLEPNSGLVQGKGAGVEYEILLAREIFNNAIAGSTEVNSPISDVFHTGIRFYCNGWEEFSNMPNSSIDEVDNGWGHLLEVPTIK